MYLSHLHIQQFRSHVDAAFDFAPGVTIISGSNGSGKTNILEAIYVLARGASFRDSDEHLVAHGKKWWKISAIVGGEKHQALYNHDRKSFVVGTMEYHRLSQQKQLPVVLFEPDDLSLVHGSPAQRRRFIDEYISASTVGYKSTLRRFERIVSQRNSLLKTPGGIDHDQLFVWDILLAEAAEIIVRARQAVVTTWNQELSDYYSRLSNQANTIHVAYSTVVDTSVHYKQSFIQKLKHNLEHDLFQGATSIGPHRDDIGFFIDNRSFIATASRGEVRSLLLALKQCHAQAMHKSRGDAPLLLLDDVFSELDTKRQQQVIDLFKNQQIIASTTHKIARRNVQHISL